MTHRDRPSPTSDEVVQFIVDTFESSPTTSTPDDAGTYAPIDEHLVERALAAVIGTPLVDWSRVLDMAIVEFGPTHLRQGDKGPTQLGEYQLHVQCGWRIVRSGRTLAGRGDYFRAPIGAPDATEDFDIESGARARGDDLVADFLAHEGAHIVTRVEASSLGDLQMSFADGCILEVLPQNTGRVDGPQEYWRFLRDRPGEPAAPHFVVTTAGIEEPLTRDIHQR